MDLNKYIILSIMLGPYTASKEGTISYKGNKVFPKIPNILNINLPLKEFENRVKDFSQNVMWKHIARINHRINLSANEFFNEMGGLYTALPLTTRMISSPGAVYGKEAISYTTDTCPITLKWFELDNTAFLSESSQIYLELAMMQNDVDHVYSIYNSFRKEIADATHLSEFHHIEYEGKVSQEQNEITVLSLVKRIIEDLLAKNENDLLYFLNEDKITELKEFAKDIYNTPRLTLKEALMFLYKDTGDSKYLKFTLKHFGAWEEVRLTEIFGRMVILKEFPLLEVPFYHSVVDNLDPKVANNSDFIWPGYRETIGSGHRVRSKEELESKAKIFQLPFEDYTPYMQTREISEYQETSGFGLGWERMLQGLLEMPFIWSASQFPRVDKTLKP